MSEENININSNEQTVPNDINANQGNDVNAYYEALKKIEKEKSKKKRIGCLIVLLIPIILLAINVIPQLIPNKKAPPSEKMNLCEMHKADSRNRVKAEEEYVKDKDGIYYRYEFVAKVVSTPAEYVDIVILCPECYDDLPQLHKARIFVGKDLAKDLYQGSWIKVDKATVASITYFAINTDGLTEIEKISESEAVEFIESK